MAFSSLRLVLAAMGAAQLECMAVDARARHAASMVGAFMTEVPETTAAADSYGHVWVQQPGYAERCSRCKTPRALGHGVTMRCEPWPLKSADRLRGVAEPHAAGSSRGAA